MGLWKLLEVSIYTWANVYLLPTSSFNKETVIWFGYLKYIEIIIISQIYLYIYFLYQQIYINLSKFDI
jgi:hypothetical protein